MPQELVAKARWAEFRDALNRNQRTGAMEVLEAAEQAVITRIRNERDAQSRKHLEDGRTLLMNLRTHVNRDSVLAWQLADQLDSFGPLRANLPDMEDFGKVVEGHGRPIAEQYFLYKIQKEKDQRRRTALAGLFEVVKGLYDQRVDPLEIAFFVRKIESLTQIVEVLKCQPTNH
jgi:hypothetical protein